MPQAELPTTERGRSATSPALRVLATCVALLLTLSALGQVAHFLLVPHAICGEHGELLDLSEGAAHSAAAQADSGSEADSRVGSDHLADEHDHCQVLARGEREQAWPERPALEIAPAALALALMSAGPKGVIQTLPALLLAPKTSPPRAGLG